MNDLVQPPLSQAFAINALSLFVSQILFLPLAGHLSDIYGRIRIMTIGGTLLLLYGPIAIYLVQLSHAFLAVVDNDVRIRWGSFPWRRREGEGE